MDSCRAPLVLEGEGEGGEEEDDDGVWLKALEGVEQDASCGQESVISEADTLVCGAAVDSEGEGVGEHEKGDLGSSELPSPAGSVNCNPVNRPADPRDLLMTEEEMSVFLCE